MTRRLLLSVLVPPLLLAPAGAAVTYRGKVTVDGGAPGGDWRVYALADPVAERPWRTPGAPVAADGAFELRDAPAGPVFLALYLGRYLDRDSVSAQNAKDGDSVTGLELATKPPRPRLTLNLTDPAGQPMATPVKVHLCGPFGRYDASTCGRTSDAGGHVVFENVPQGSYDVWLDAAGTPYASGLFHALTAAGDTDHWGLKLAPAGGLRGRLMLPDGAGPARGWTVAVQSGASAAPGEACAAAEFASGAADGYAESEVGADGAWELKNLPAGPVVLDVRQPGAARAADSFEATVQAGSVVDAGQRAAGATWRHLLDGHSLTGWSESDFFGRRPITLEHGWVNIPTGEDMSGITWAGGPLPKRDYEVTLQGMRTAGHDFWCGLTFPVGDDPLSLILGGWGGSVTGLSSLDGSDASQNESTGSFDFDQWRWYRVRLRVSGTRIQAWIDGKSIVDVDVKDRRLSIRLEVEASKPFGIATWCTSGAVRDLRIRSIATP
jgi:hypothetical protein